MAWPRLGDGGKRLKDDNVAPVCRMTSVCRHGVAMSSTRVSEVRCARAGVGTGAARRSSGGVHDPRRRQPRSGRRLLQRMRRHEHVRLGCIDSTHGGVLNSSSKPASSVAFLVAVPAAPASLRHCPALRQVLPLRASRQHPVSIFAVTIDAASLVSPNHTTSLYIRKNSSACSNYAA